MALLPLVVSVMVLTSIVGCEHNQLNPSNTVRYVQILDTVQSAVLYAQVGHEIRWQNLSDKVVHLRFLDKPNWETVTCERGISVDGPQAGFCDDQTEGVRQFVLLDAQHASLRRLVGLGELAEQH